MYIQREIEKAIVSFARQFPVIVVTGPRQSGKTTLVRNVFGDKPYFNLELPDVSDIIQQDPRSFFNKLTNGAVIDEIQRMPELLRYIQGIVDEVRQPGMFILTGSNQFMLMNQVTESLAGRVALFKLLPFSLSEVEDKLPSTLTDDLILNGYYPAVVANRFEPYRTYQNYYETYLERDLRSMINIKNLSDFKKFVRLCAGRVGQIFNASALANETGVSVHTIKSWISILEASYIIFLLPPWYDNINKRLIKSPKVYFYDTGLLSYILGIENKNQLSRDPLRGNIFENMVIAEFYKKRYNRGLDARYYFFRDNHGNEVDLIIPHGNEIQGIEIKSSQTFNKEFLKGLHYLKDIYPQRNIDNLLIYDGEDIGNVSDTEIINFRSIAKKNRLF
ncbi:MAG: AAA family ATPase [Bacteroidetes bacterium HGW-Bacteroidetes-16]|jgi:hypothetical protein|nr:MAG: AAA family ATPase [Bacteroidetes bacterium HGW-Bacteroidetes-16]